MIEFSNFDRDYGLQSLEIRYLTFYMKNLPIPALAAAQVESSGLSIAELNFVWTSGAGTKFPMGFQVPNASEQLLWVLLRVNVHPFHCFC